MKEVHWMILPKLTLACLGIVVVVGLASCTNNNAGNSETTSKDAQPRETTSPKQVEKVKPSPGKGNVQGAVVYNEKPVENIEVKLCETFNRYMRESCGGKTYKATTDKEGYYIVKDVEPGIYQALLVRVFDTDRYIFAAKGIGGLEMVKYEVAAGQTLFTESKHLYKSDLKLLEPAAASRVDGQKLALQWQPYKDAAYYKLNLYPKDMKVEGIYNKRIEGKSFTVDKPLAKGEYRWTVEAYNSNDKKLSESSDDITFVVD
jgi:hypothetical protein